MKTTYLLFIIISTTIANLLLLINYNGIYWDDFVIYNHNPETILALIDQQQAGLRGIFALLMLHSGNQVFSFRIFLFFSELLIVILYFLSISRLKGFNEKEVFLTSLLIISLPFTSARVAITVIPFYLPLLLFWIGIYIFIRFYMDHTERKAIKYALYITFTASFSTNSLLVFYYGVLFLIFWSNSEKEARLQSFLKLLYMHKGFLLLPLLYYAAKIIGFVRWGLYAGYNALSVPEPGSIIVNTLTFFRETIKQTILLGWELYSKIFNKLSIDISIALILSGAVFLYNRAKFYSGQKAKERMIIGIFLILCGAFPYLVLGKVPAYLHWHSRFQVLLPVGVSLFIYYGLSYVSKKLKLNRGLSGLIFVMLITLFISRKFYSDYRFLKENFYQAAVVEQFKKSDKIKYNTSFIVENFASFGFAYDRVLDFYEWNGLLRKAFSDSKRLMVSSQYSHDWDDIVKLKNHRQYNFWQWKPGKTVKIRVLPAYNPGWKEKVKILYFYVTDDERYKELATDLVKVE